MPAEDSTALTKESEKIIRNRDEDFGPRSELNGDATTCREDAEVGTVIHDIGGNRIREASPQRHQLVATVVPGAQLRKGLERAVVESPPNIFDDRNDAARMFRDWRAAHHLDPRAPSESHQELRQSHWQKAGVGVDKDEDIASEPCEDGVQRGSFPASLLLTN